LSTSQHSSRLTWAEVRVGEARLIGQRSLCVRDQVGAIIVDATQRIIAEGYNGPPQGFPHNDQPCDQWCERAKMATIDRVFSIEGQPVLSFGPDVLRSDYSDCPALHAEANALAVCDRRDREGGTIYVASDVCWGCAKLIANSGLAHVIVIDRGRTHRDSQRSYDFMRDCGLEVKVVIMGHAPASSDDASVEDVS
jgi:dCMP deaminase